MNIGETIEAQNKTIITLQTQNAELVKKIAELQKFNGSGDYIDAGIGHIGYSCSGSIDLLELMETLKSVIKSNGVRDTIRILAMAV